MKRLIIPLPCIKKKKKKKNYSLPFNFKNIQIRGRLIIPLYSPLHYSPPLYSSLPLNFQT